MTTINQQRTAWPSEITYATGTGGRRLHDWIAAHRNDILARLERIGVVLLRQLSLISSAQFGTVAAALFGADLAPYTHRSTPRTELRGKVYTSTEYPPEEVIPQHSENAYSHEWPMKIGFLCLVPASSGGATPITDNRRVYEGIPADIREKFERKGIAYIRNYGPAGVSWQESFQTPSRAEVESYCRLHGIEYQWTAEDGLRTRQVGGAVAIHPYTGAKVWFNQAHLFHVSNHTGENREALQRAFHESDLPRHAYYADGEPLEEGALAMIRAVYERETRAFPWELGDLLLLDNMLCAHGRQSYTGSRKVLVAMAEPRAWGATP